MSKSLGNYIGITEAPDQMFGKLMSISDDLMWRYFDLLSFRPNADLERLKQEVAGRAQPRDVKFELGVEIVDRFHGAGSGPRARDEFIARFQQGALPEDLAEITLTAAGGSIGIAHLLKGAGLVTSTSDAYRQLKQGAVRIDGARVEDGAITFAAGACHVFQVGKRRLARVTIALDDWFCRAASVVKLALRERRFEQVLTQRSASLYCAPFRSDPGRPVVEAVTLPAEDCRWQC